MTAACAEAVLADFENDLPDLGRAVILLPEALHHIKPQFVELRNRLLEGARKRGVEALIAPQISTPWRLFMQRRPPGPRMPTAHELKLLLADALEQHPGLFPSGSVWQLASELLRFFDEVSELDEAHDAGGELLERHLARLDHQVWSDETEMLLTLWRGWRGLFDSGDDAPERFMDAGAAYRGELLRGGLLGDGEHAYLCGSDLLTPCQTVWARKLHDQGRLTILTNADAATDGRTTKPRYPDPAAAMLKDVTGETPAAMDNTDANTDRSDMLDQIFSAENTPLAERARNTSQRFATSPLVQRLRIFRPRTLEEHAWGVYLAVRQWLAEDKTVGIVSLDRRLTRRLRAVFERQRLSLYDTSGWELSTTSSAGALQNLLLAADAECAAREVLALMRSPWCDHSTTRQHALAAAWRIEEQQSQSDCPPQTTRDWLDRLRAMPGPEDDATILAQHIADIADGLRRLAASGERRAFTEYYEHLRAAMDSLGMEQKFRADSAGERMLKELEETHQAAAAQQTRGTFRAWRNWLSHNLESANFVPPAPDNGIALMNLRQSRLARFDALAVVSLDKRHLPAPPQPGLVDEKIRRELGLETREQREAFQFHLFRRLLESTDTVLLSCQQNAGNRTLEPSPWLSAITEFHRLAYGDDLDDRQLARRARRHPRQPETPACGRTVQLQTRPAPAAPREAWPEKFSAAAHKTLMDCPYRFFVRYGLRIRKRRDSGDYWGPAEYGTHLHRCLQALNEDLSGLPGPMTKPWTSAHLEDALQLAREIVNAEFSQAAAANHANRHLRAEALGAVEYYVRWMVGRFGREPALSLEAERKYEETLDDEWTLIGRLDLVATASSGQQVVDYKGGRLPSHKDITQGEDVQLSSYALLAEDAHAVLYLGLGEHKVLEVGGDALDECRDEAHWRLLQMRRDFMDGAPLTAWGDEKKACKHCDHQGLCRRPAWRAYPTGDTGAQPAQQEKE